MKNSSHLLVILALLFAGCSTPLSRWAGKEPKWQRTIRLKTESPLDQVIAVGGTVRFAVSTKANETTYQWIFGCDPIPNATNQVLTLSNITTNQTGYYTCIAYRGLDMQASEPMQLISMQRIDNDTIVLGAKPPPGGGGPSIFQGVTPPAGRNERFSSRLESPSVESPNNAGGAVGAAPIFTGGHIMLSQMSVLMLDITNSLTYIGSVEGTGCPKPYSGYVRYTQGWYPISGSAWRATALWSNCSALVFDDRYRSGCQASGDFNLTLVSPALVTSRLHRFVAYFPPGSPPNTSTTYLLRLTGFRE